MSAQHPGTGTARFRPRARMVKILGEHLIRDNTVGLMELVKNGYDADAQTVRVELHHLQTLQETTVVVQDDGVGMTEEIIHGPWFEPAHGGKESQKETGSRTPLGRLPLGEKGVGRFAAQKLGHRLELVSRPVGEQVEFVVSIDWRAFEGAEQYLDEIEIPITSRKPEIFQGETHGTRLTMQHARQIWTRRDIQRFQASLIRLISPRKGIENFRVELICPEYLDLENLEHYDILEHYQYRIDCAVDEKGLALFEYRQRQPDGGEEIGSEEQNIWALIHSDDWYKYNPACGPFFVQVSAWLLDAKLLEQYGLTRDLLRILGGVSIYRDGFRVLPYGDEGDDWLGLDQRRINVPAKRFGNRQVIGIVEIDQAANPGLIDKTNREGLQENQAYQDLHDIVLGVIQILEQQSLEQRKSTQKSHVSRRELEATIEELKQEIHHLREESPLSDLKPEKSHLSSAEADSKNAIADTEDTLDGTEDMVLVPKEKLDELEAQAEYISQAVNEIYESQEEERDTFLHLLGIGLAAERFSHEFDRLVDGSSRYIKDLKSSTTINKEKLDQLELFVNVLRNEIRLMGTLRYVRRSQSAQQHSVKRIIQLVWLAYREALHEAQIQVELKLDDDFEVYVSEASLAQVIDNIIHNAIYWLKQKVEIKDRRLRIEIISAERNILISNNGPAILPNIRRRLFKYPFTTSKQPEGRGLGMYIAAEILKRNGGQITIASSEDTRILSGAAFSIKFTNNPPKK